jgi:hypothetical protein
VKKLPEKELASPGCNVRAGMSVRFLHKRQAPACAGLAPGKA